MTLFIRILETMKYVMVSTLPCIFSQLSPKQIVSYYQDTSVRDAGFDSTAELLIRWTLSDLGILGEFCGYFEGIPVILCGYFERTMFFFGVL